MAVAESTPIPEVDLNRWLTQLRSNDVTLRSDAAHQLGKLGDERAVPVLVEALSDSDEYVRKSAVTALRRIGGPAAREGLRQALAHRSEQAVRLAAISVLGRMGDRRVAAPLVHLFLDDPRMQEAVVTTLARLEERKVIEPPGSHAADREIFLPKDVVDGFLGRPREEVTKVLTEALENPSAKVRRCALKSIYALFGETALDHLVAALKDEDIDVKRLAIKILGKMRNKRVIDPLLQLILHDGEQVEEAAWNTLKVLTDLREYDELRARVAKERAGGRPAVRKYAKSKDVSPDWWREQD